MSKVVVLPPGVAEKLGPFYVYLLVDPRNDEIFYVGKGTKQRLLDHGREADLTGEKGNGRKQARIREIRAAGKEPRIDVVRHHLDEATALAVESALIEVLPDLTNAVRGHGEGQRRAPLAEYISQYGAPRVKPTAPPAVLIRLGGWDPAPEELEAGYFRGGHGYHAQMTLNEVVDASRGWWVVNDAKIRKLEIEYAVAVHQGLTRAVMKIGAWHTRADGRRAFEATPLVDGPVFDAWVGPDGKRIDHFFKPGAQTPIRYWPA